MNNDTQQTTGIDPGEGFGLLVNNEPIQVGDEWAWKDRPEPREWHLCGEQVIGLDREFSRVVVRRRIAPPQPRPAVADGPSLSARIMALPCVVPPDPDEATWDIFAMGYRVGHQDACHAAAELAAPVDARIAELEAAVISMAKDVWSVEVCIKARRSKGDDAFIALLQLIRATAYEAVPPTQPASTATDGI